VLQFGSNLYIWCIIFGFTWWWLTVAETCCENKDMCSVYTWENSCERGNVIIMFYRWIMTTTSEGDPHGDKFFSVRGMWLIQILLGHETTPTQDACRHDFSSVSGVQLWARVHVPLVLIPLLAILISKPHRPPRPVTVIALLSLVKNRIKCSMGRPCVGNPVRDRIFFVIPFYLQSVPVQSANCV
jgi:hypothetical protein